MVMSAITVAFASLKEATQLLKGFNELKTEAEVSAKTIELNHIISSVQNDLFEAQSAYSSAVSRIDNLEKELMALKNWSAEQECYQLYEIHPGSFVYRLKPEKQNGEPVHHLCPQCYHQGIKSILQNGGRENHHKLICNHCGSKIIQGSPTNPAVAVQLPEPTLDF